MTRARRNRLLAAGAASVCLLAVWGLTPDATSWEPAMLALLCSIGWGHLVVPLAALGRAGGAARMHFLVASASLLLLFAVAAESAPGVASAACIALAAWHFVENDRALEDAYARGGRMPGLNTRRGWFGLGLLAAIGLVSIFGLSTAMPGVSSALLGAFVFGSLFHVFGWVVLSLQRAAMEARAGAHESARRRRRSLLAAHTVSAAAGAFLWFGTPPQALARELFFSPGLYLFASALHVVQTAWLRTRAV